MAVLSNRNFVGSEVSSEYCELANERLNKTNDERRK
jgi:DNA modification methylase